MLFWRGNASHHEKSMTWSLTTCTVKKTVTSLDGVVDGISTSRVLDLPETEANLRHLIATVELDCGSGGSHRGVSESTGL